MEQNSQFSQDFAEQGPQAAQQECQNSDAVKPQYDCMTEGGFGIKRDDAQLLAAALAKLQAKRDAAISRAEEYHRWKTASVAELQRRETVAKQQAGLLDELDKDALWVGRAGAVDPSKLIAPESLQLAGVLKRLEALELQVKRQANRIDELQRKVSSMSLQQTETVRLVDRHFNCTLSFEPNLPPEYQDVNPQTERTKLYSSRIDDGERAGCVHEIHKPNTTVSAITRKKSRCTVCARVWELP